MCSKMMKDEKRYMEQNKLNNDEESEEITEEEQSEDDNEEEGREVEAEIEIV